MRTLVLGGFFLAIGAYAPEARAEPRTMTPEARAHFDRGSELYAGGYFDAAVAELRAGYALDAHPDFLYALGQAERRGGRCPAALEAYREFLLTHPTPAEATRTQENIARCESRPGGAPPGAASGTAGGVPPAGGKAAVSPWYADGIGMAATATGIVVAAAGTTFLFLGDGSTRRANDAFTYGAYLDDSAAAQRFRVAGGACLVAGAALIAIGIVRFATRGDAHPHRVGTSLLGGAF